jgi:hypothetical protein
MKNLLVAILCIIGLSSVNGQKFTDIDKSVMDASYYPSDAPFRSFAKTPEAKAAAEPKIKVIYSRPMAKGRKVFGELLEFGKPWRLGANESTEIIFMTDVEFGGKAIKAGRYSLIAVPQKDSWTIYLNTELDGWGDYSYKPELDLASVKVATQNSKETIEALSIAMYEKSKNVVHVKIGWDNTIVEVPITLK